MSIAKSTQSAACGNSSVADLSRRLTQRYGKGFSSTNLKYFRLSYQAFSDRMAIRHPLGDESVTPETVHPVGGELVALSHKFAGGRP